MTSTMAPPRSGVRFSLTLPEELYLKYQKQAEEAGVPTEDLMAVRLQRCSGHNAEKGLYVNDETRRRIEKVLGTNLNNSRELAENIERGHRVTVEGVKIVLNTEQIQRLRSRCFHQKWEQFVTEIVIEGIERYVGLR